MQFYNHDIQKEKDELVSILYGYEVFLNKKVYEMWLNYLQTERIYRFDEFKVDIAKLKKKVVITIGKQQQLLNMQEVARVSELDYLRYEIQLEIFINTMEQQYYNLYKILINEEFGD